MEEILKPYREHVGKQIRAARVQAGLSHDALGLKVGTSRQHLIKLEKGQHLARPDMLARIAAATGQPVSFFRPDPGQDRAPATDAAA